MGDGGWCDERGWRGLDGGLWGWNGWRCWLGWRDWRDGRGLGGGALGVGEDVLARDAAAGAGAAHRGQIYRVLLGQAAHGGRGAAGAGRLLGRGWRLGDGGWGGGDGLRLRCEGARRGRLGR